MGWGLGFQPNNLLLITADNYNTILLITQGSAVSGDQQDSVDSAGQLWPAACNLDVQLCRHGPVTVLFEFLNNRLCHYYVFGLISCDNQHIANFKKNY